MTTLRLSFQSFIFINSHYCTEFVNRGDLVISQTVRAALEERQITFQEVVDCLQDRDTLTFEVSSLTLETLQISNAITIRSSPDASTSLTCLDGPIFIIDADGVNINNLEISRCRLDSADAPIVLRSGNTLELSSVNFTNNRNGVGSASLRIGRDSRLVIDECSFHRNNGTDANVLATSPGCEVTIRRSRFGGNRGGGSALSIADGNQLNIFNSRFTNNQATQGGGVIRLESPDERTSVVIDGASEFRNNEALTGEGGAIFATGSVTLIIRQGTVFNGNRAAHQGGALFITGSATVRIVDAYFIENESLFLGGGAIFAENSTSVELEVEISNTLFSRNAARNQLGSGGAIRLQGTGVRCVLDNGVSFTSNRAELDGGAIHITNVPSLIVQEASFIGNEAYQGGAAALYVVSTMNANVDTMVMDLRIQSCSFLFNRAVTTFRGGGTLGFVGARTEAVIEGCRFHENECPEGSGAAVYIFDGPVITISNSSFAHNTALWGGAIYAEMNCKCNISNSVFFGNNAEEGGAISTLETVDLEVVDSQFMNNSAKEDGGAVRSEHHALSRGSGSLFTFINCQFSNNNAGYDLAANADRSRSTRGGGILVIGRGQYVRINGTTFRNNTASEGGGIDAIGPRQFFLAEQTRFEANVASFGGGIFTSVDNSVDIVGGRYLLDGVQFVNNTASSDGGAVRISSPSSTNNLFPYNAAERTVGFRNCAFRRNSALTNGGGMMVTGVGLELRNIEFVTNAAFRDARVATSGYGGGIAAVDGASISISDSDLRNNVASVSGGGLFVMDSSVAVFRSNFTRNRVSEDNGNGGAVALMLTSNRMIPRLESGPFRNPLLFRCNDCRFVRNNASVHGGAIYHHHSDPTANYSEDLNCENLNFPTHDQFRTALDFNLTCMWIVQTAELLRNRHIRLARVQFIRNEAQSGAGLFTNHPDTINVTDGDLGTLGVRFRQAVINNTFLEEAGIIFRDNIISARGYGPDYASFPGDAYMVDENNTDGVLQLTYDDTRLGDFLRFNVAFHDAFDQRVTRFDDLTAELHADRNVSGNLSLPIANQTVEQIGNNGIISFVEIVLQGSIKTTYRFGLRFLYRGVEVHMNEPLNIDITIESCRIGQTMSTEQGSRRCVDCGTGEFNADPMGAQCQPCGHNEGRRCFGIVSIPEDHYWHVSSHDIKVYKCIGREACAFEGRFKTINETEFRAHLNNAFVSHAYNNSYECATGYHGILCGSCRPGYGREGESCRECASNGVRYFLLLMLILWSIGFVGYFLRSVLQVSSKIEFNKKLARSPTLLPAQTETKEDIEANSTPKAEASASGHSTLEIQPDEKEDTFDEGSSPPRRYSTSAMQEQTQSTHQVVVPSQRDLARATASEINRQRSLSGFRRGAGSATTLRRSRNRKRTTLSVALHEPKNNPSRQTIQSLPLANPLSELLKVLINFLQVTSVAVTVNLEWSEAVRATLLSIGSAANLSTGSGFFSLDCFLESGALQKSLKRMTMTTLFPAALLLLFIFLWAIYALMKKRTLKYFLQRSWVTCLAVVYFFYINITENLLRFFACVKIDEDVDQSEDSRTYLTIKGYYWEEDTAVQCYKDKHALLVGVLVGPLLCVVTIGFPLGTVYILQLKGEHLEEEDVVGTYGFLYQSYNQRFWEVLIMLRKASIAAIVVFVYSLGANMQGLLCVLVLMVCLSLHLSFVPFRKEIHRLNHLETCSLSASIAVFVCGLMFKDGATSEEAELFLSVFAILCVVGTLCLILINLILSGEEFLDMKLLELQVMDRDDLLDHSISIKSWRLLSHYMHTLKNQLLIRGTPFNKETNLSMGTSVQMAESSTTQPV